MSDGGLGGLLLRGIAGVHAVVKAPPGPFGGKVYAASWATQQVFSVEPDGGIGVVASGLSLTNYGANALAFSPDGTILLVADRAANRVVCIERGP